MITFLTILAWLFLAMIAIGIGCDIWASCCLLARALRDERAYQAREASRHTD